MPDDKNVTPINKNKKKTKVTINDPQLEAAAQYFVPLGHMDGHFFFMTTRGKHVISFSAAALSNKANLFSIAPLAWWERQYMTDNGFKGEAVDNAVSWIISLCYDKGAFVPKKVRGRGAWWDDGRSVLHLGDHLLVDNKRVELLEFESDNIYEAGPKMRVDIESTATDDESIKLVELCTSFNWESPLHGILAAGWVVTALVCGSLPWRPHLITTGPSGSGKTWVATHIFQHVLGDFRISAKGNTSEAGLRHELRHDSIAVTFDEAEENMDNVLALMRQASAETDGDILKGGQDGTATKYTIRSAFNLFAIRVPMQQTADENRVTVLTLCHNTREEQDEFMENMAPHIEAIESSEWADRIRSRVFANIRTLRHNTKVFSRAMTKAYSARVGQQYGPLLGGAWLLGTIEPVTMEVAMEKIKGMEHLLEDVKEINSETDEAKLVSSLMAKIIKVPGDRRTVERSVGELIMIATEQIIREEVLPDIAFNALGRVGIVARKEDVIVANQHDGVKNLLAKTQWKVGWSHILRRLPGAKAISHPIRFGGRKGRGVSIPMEAFV